MIDVDAVACLGDDIKRAVHTEFALKIQSLFLHIFDLILLRFFCVLFHLMDSKWPENEANGQNCIFINLHASIANEYVQMMLRAVHP